jgi:hypothetical protein
MRLEQICALSPTIAALALVLSLIYPSLQFRINTKVARNARLIAAAAVFQDFGRLLASNVECARISRDGLNDLPLVSHRWNRPCLGGGWTSGVLEMARANAKSQEAASEGIGQKSGQITR